MGAYISGGCKTTVAANDANAKSKASKRLNDKNKLNWDVLFEVPTPRQEWIGGKFIKHSHGESDEAESWVELFIDLVYVSLLLKLGSLLVSCYYLQFIIGRVLVLFGNLILTRFAIDEYANRFYSNNLTQKLLYLLLIMGVFVQVLNINTSHYAEKKCLYIPEMSVGIMSGIMLTKISIILVHLLVMYHNPRARKQFEWDFIRWTISLFLMVINLIMHYNGWEQAEWLDFLFILILVVQEVAIWIFSRAYFRKNFEFPFDLELLQTRWGIWVMIVIGESVIQLLVAELNSNDILMDYVHSIVCLVILFSLGMQYYDSCQRKYYEHAMTQNVAAGFTWIWLHPILTFFLFGVGASFKMSTAHYNYGVIYNSSRLLSLGIGLTTFSFTLILSAHDGFKVEDSKKMYFFLVRALLSIAQMTVYIWPITKVGDQRMRVAVCHLIICCMGFNLADTVFEVVWGHNYKREDRKRKSLSWNSLDLIHKEEGFLTVLLYTLFPSLRPQRNKSSVSPHSDVENTADDEADYKTEATSKAEIAVPAIYNSSSDEDDDRKDGDPAFAASKHSNNKVDNSHHHIVNFGQSVEEA
jgi:hypothetical protein